MKNKKPRVLMFGWEFPPRSTGGLGTACYGLTKGLLEHGVQITLVLPHDVTAPNANMMKIISTGSIKVREVKSMITPYMSYEEYDEKARMFKLQRGKKNLAHKIRIAKSPSSQMYGKNLLEEVNRYAEIAADIARNEDFDVIHCHDWMTFMAGIKAKEATKKPLVVHVHSTEFDRTGGHGVNQQVYDVEKYGMQYAAYVIAVSNFTKGMISEHYGIQSEKIFVVHNAVDNESRQEEYSAPELKKSKKIVLFLGRITLQKGPDYFIQAAKKALEFMPDLMFVIAGNGDMQRFVIEKAAELGIADKIIFTGFVSGQDVDRIYKMADVYIMPSVSEPFGITALEAMKNGIPTIISKQSGVSEVIGHCLKVDFWDINQLANKMVCALKYNELKECLGENGYNEARKFSWYVPAKKCLDVYEKII